MEKDQLASYYYYTENSGLAQEGVGETVRKGLILHKRGRLSLRDFLMD